MTNEEKKLKFISNFSNTNGFYGLTNLVDSFGFSIKRKLNRGDNNVSLFSVYIRDDEIDNDRDKKIIYIRATYGRDSDRGVTLRDINESRIIDPIDYVFEDYYYDINKNEILKKKEISGEKMLNSIYKRHTKSTKMFRGFCLRIKLFFFRILMKQLFNVISKFFIFITWLITGDKYKFDPILKREFKNGLIIKSDFLPDNLELERNSNIEITPAEKINFFGNEIDYWCVVFYSILHLVIYFIFYYLDIKPSIITILLNNTFLTLIYVIASLWLLEKAIPFIFKYFMKFSAILSVNFLYKKIKI